MSERSMVITTSIITMLNDFANFTEHHWPHTVSSTLPGRLVLSIARRLIFLPASIAAGARKERLAASKDSKH